MAEYNVIWNSPFKHNSFAKQIFGHSTDIIYLKKITFLLFNLENNYSYN